METLETLQQHTIGILGFGKEGQAIARFLARHALHATIYEAKPASDFSAEEIAALQSKGFMCEFGYDFSTATFAGCTLLFRSPGIPRLHAQLRAAEQRGVVVTSQTKWFFDHCPALVIGVTGTKGKGTTTTLIARILEAATSQGVATDAIAANARVYVTGNIGKQDPFDILEELQPKDIVVFELSSFQLQDLTKSPQVGVCLMVTSEHLDHHRDLQEYHAAKSAITQFQQPSDIAVYSDDYPASQAIGLLSQGKRYAYSRKHQVEAGAYCVGEDLYLVNVGESGMIPVANRQLRGGHNLENISAAAVVAAALGVPLPIIATSVVEFPGLEDRLEYVGEFDGVRFYNDSISTVPESAVAAIDSFTEPTILLLGGSEKHSDFTQLAAHIAASPQVTRVIVVGETAPRITDALVAAHYSGVVRTGPQTMAEIFTHVQQLARAGDVVLLSPACASFGMFKNYKDRGQQFKAAAKKFTRAV